MTHESQWQREWAVLRAERDLARRRWRSAADGLAARARDPLGLGGLVREHPVVAGGIGAAIVALVVKYVAGRVRKPEGGASPDGVARPASAWTNVLRDAAMGIALPWLVRTLKAKFGWEFEPAASQGARQEQSP